MKKQDKENVNQLIGKYKEDKNFTLKELNRLNELLIKYYPPEFNIYFIQGLTIGNYSIGHSPYSVFYLDYEGDRLIQPIRDFENEAEKEEFHKLYQLMCLNCVHRLTTYKTFTPLTSMKRMHTEYSSFTEYSEEEKRNLLSWYMGYCLMQRLHYNSSAIDNYINDKSDIDYQPDFHKFYVACIGIQFELAKFLLDHLKPNFTNHRLLIAVEFLNSLSLDSGDKFDMRMLPQNIFDSLLVILKTSYFTVEHENAKRQQQHFHVNENYKIH